MTTFEYTHRHKVNSSWLDEVFYNADKNVMAVLTTGKGVYCSPNSDESDFNNLVHAESPGKYFNENLHDDFTYIGSAEYGYVNFTQVTEPNYVVTNEHSLDPVSVANEFAAEEGYDEEEPTNEHSLQAVESDNFEVNAEIIDDNVKSVVVEFSLDALPDKVYTYEADSNTAEDAIYELNEYVSRLGMSGRVKRVVVNFV